MFKNLRFVVCTEEDNAQFLAKAISKERGKVLKSIQSKNINFYIQSWNVEENSNNLQICQERNITVAPGHYIMECIKNRHLISFELYSIDEYRNVINNNSNSKTNIFQHLMNAKFSQNFFPANVSCLENESIPQTFQEFHASKWKMPTKHSKILLLPIITKISGHSNTNSMESKQNENVFCGKKRQQRKIKHQNNKRRKLNTNSMIINSNNNNSSFDSNSECMMSLIRDFIAVYFQMNVQIIGGIELHLDSKQNIINIDDQSFAIRSTIAKQEQKNSNTKYEVCDMIDAVLYLYENGNDSKSAEMKNGYCIIGITDEDIYESGDECGILRGRAFGGSSVAVFSTFSYIQNNGKNEKQSFLMLCNTIAHEILHCFGIDHCVFYSCVMNAWTDIIDEYEYECNRKKEKQGEEENEIAVASMHLCPIDLKKLQSVVGFDAHVRYGSLEKFYMQNVHFQQQGQWISQIIEKLNIRVE